MHKIYELEELIEKEIDQILTQGCVKPDQWANLGKAVDIAKDISTIKAMENGTDYGDYSRDARNSYATPYYRRYPEPDRYSYEGGRDGNMGRSYGGSYESGQNTQEAILLLERKLDHTQDPKMRESLMNTIDLMKRS